VLLNARFVKGFVVGNKNGFNDVEAIFSTVTRPNKRMIAVKKAQQDIQMLHCLRQQRIDQCAG
jgi:transposase